MALSTDFTAQFGMLPKSAQEAIFADMTANDNPLPTMNMNVNGRAVTGPVFKGDAGKTDVTVGPLTAADLGALQAVQRPQQPGALSMAPMPRREPVDIASMLERFVPQDDSQAKYLALAAGFGSATKTGSFSEQIGNVASAMNEQKMQQAKLRSQYAPLIMQQVAAQQAREEQNIYRLEAQREAQAAAQAAAQQAQQFRADQQAETIRAANERATADRTSREFIVSERLAAERAKRDELKAAETLPTTNPEPILGVPVPRVLPWANQSNQKNADKVRMAEIAKGSKEIEADADAAKKNLTLAQEAARFAELNAKVGTGGVSDRLPGGQWLQSFGDEYNEMQAISARLTPAMREAGSGATSDFDAKMFQRGTVGVDKPKPVNDNIAAALVSRAKLAQDYADFRSTYLEQNGTLLGSNEQWGKYVNENPIFDPKDANTMAMNPARVGWRDYFGKPRTDAQSAAPMAPAAPGGWSAKRIN